MSNINQKIEGTIVWVAPFYNRSGYGVGARAAVTALHNSGARIRVISVNEVEEGIDDADINLIKSLEKTPIIPPVTIIVYHVPSMVWFDIKLPEPNLWIIATTFDGSAQGNLPPKEWFDVFDKMDSIWFNTYKEKEVFNAAGIDNEKMEIVYFPHPWLENSQIPDVKPEYVSEDKPFRFLSIAMFQPRRRWDSLIESYLEEFKNGENVELYLKVNYPAWHPIPGRPKLDLQNLISDLRKKTGSNAKIIVDDEIGTRKGIVDLFDSCNVYVTTDTTSTGPVAEAKARKRLVVIPEGILPIKKDIVHVEIPVDKNAFTDITKEMLLYQPYHKETKMPKLHISDVKDALRRAYAISPEEKNKIIECALGHIRSPKQIVPIIYNAINKAWEYKNKLLIESDEKNHNKIIWEGAQFAYHSLALINREITSRLIKRGKKISLNPLGPDQFFPSKNELTYDNKKYYNKFKEGEITVRHQWPPNLEAPKSGYWINIQPWEYGSLPQSWAEVFSNQVDEMWVPSKYVKQVYIESGVPEERVFVVPNGVDVNKFNMEARPYKLKTNKKLKFLFVGGTIYRKGIDILLEAYSEAFSSEDDVCLVIKDMGGKSFYRGQTASELILKFKKNENAPAIEYIDKNLNEKELIRLYTACDVLIHPYRGEGFGLPVLEAMACGLPVIVTEGGSTDDFCNKEYSFKIKSTIAYLNEKTIDNMPTVNYPWLLIPSKEDLIEKMKFILNTPSLLKSMGRNAAEFAKKHFTWEKIVDLVEERLSKVTKNEIVRYTAVKDSDLAVKFYEQIAIMNSQLDEKEYLAARDALYNAIGYYDNLNDKAKVELKYTELLGIAGNINIVLNDFVSAQKYFEENLNLDPNSSEACMGLGIVFKEADMLQQSKIMLEWAVKNDNKNISAFELLSETNLLLGLSENDFSASGNIVSGNYYMNKPEDETEALLYKMLESISELYRLQQFDSALEILNSNNNLFYTGYVEGERNEMLSIYENLKGWSYLGKGDIENAHSSFESALKLNSNSSEACSGLGEVFLAAEMLNESKTMLEWAVKYDSNNLEAAKKLNHVLKLISENNTEINADKN